jgi:hypothetical protein
MQTEVQLLAPSEKLALFETSKKDREDIVSDVMYKLDQGLLSPFKVLSELKSMEDIVKKIAGSEWFKAMTLEEARKYPDKVIEMYNATFQIKEQGTKYDYSVCNDPVLKALHEQQDTIDQQVKEREAFLKTVPVQGLETLIEDELVTLFPPAKTSTTGITTTLK